MRNDPIVNEKVNAIVELLHWCEANKVPYAQIRALAEASYELATGVDAWECGEVKTNKEESK